MGEHSPARVLAPAALAAFALVFVIVVALSMGGSGSRTVASDSSVRHTARAHRRRRVYTVRRGECLSSIAARTGVPIERLQELNPSLDPQMLRPGQRLKLRR